VQIETARLRLRAHRDDDLAELVLLAGDWEVARWLAMMPHPYGESDGRDWIALVREDHATGRPRRFAIALKDTDQLIGGVGLDGSTGDKSEEPALGYWLGEPYWGRGYAREAVAAVLDYGLRILGLATIRAYTGPAIWLRKRFCCTAVSKKSAKSSSSSRPVMAPGTPLCSASRNRRWHDKRANLVAELR
jgi:RimJ/RimL family protein N-acetyltransferase